MAAGMLGSAAVARLLAGLLFRRGGQPAATLEPRLSSANSSFTYRQDLNTDAPPCPRFWPKADFGSVATGGGNVLRLPLLAAGKNDCFAAVAAGRR